MLGCGLGSRWGFAAPIDRGVEPGDESGTRFLFRVLDNGKYGVMLSNKPCFVSWRVPRLFVVFALVMAAGSASARAEQQETPGAVVGSTPTLSAFSVQALVIEQGADGLLTTTVQIDDQTWTLELQPHSIRSDAFQVLVQTDNSGVLYPVEAPPMATYRGSVAEVPEAIVTGSYWDGELEAVIYTPDHTYGIDPLIGGAAGEYRVYRAADSSALNAGFCGTQEADLGLGSAGPAGGGATGRGATLEVADLGIDADVEYFNLNGEDVSTTVRDIEGVINGLEPFYEVPAIGITYEVTTIIVRTVEPDPYSSSDAFTLIDQFQSEWNSSPESFIQRDVAQLFTGKNIQSGIVGIAITSSVCIQGSAYSMVESKFSSQFADRLAVSAHELGHNWSAFHCDAFGSDCKIMCSDLNLCTGIHDEFGNISSSTILSFKNSRTCLSDVPDPLSMPFFDSFESTTLDTDKWTYVNGPTSNDNAANEPSGPFSLNLDTDGSSEYQGDDIRTNEILLSGATEPVLQFWTQHDGVEAGEVLLVDYYSLTGEWKELELITSDGVDQTEFELHVLDVPLLGFHNGFRVRFRTEADNANDDWYVDNVSVSEAGEGDFLPPSPNPMTFAETPLPQDVSSIIMVATTATDDTPPIEYDFDFVGGGPNGTDSGWQSSTTYIDTDLVANELYTYQVRARDSADFLNQTGFSASESTATAIQTPTLLVIATPTTNSLTLVAIGTFSNLVIGESGLFFDSLTAGGDAGINEWIQITVDTATGLSPDTFYEFQLKARNQVGLETDFSPAFGGATLANVPGAPTLTGADCDTLNVNVDPNGNPANTTFAIQVTDTAPLDGTWNGMYLDAAGNPSVTDVFQTDSAWGTSAVLGMQSSTIYTFAVTAQNQDGELTDPGPEESLATTAECGEPCEGDANGDGTVDPLDSGFVLARFGCPVGTGDKSCDAADANGDGEVDPLDSGFVLARFGDCD